MKVETVTDHESQTEASAKAANVRFNFNRSKGLLLSCTRLSFTKYVNFYSVYILKK